MQATLTRPKRKGDELEVVIHVPLGPHPVNAATNEHELVVCNTDCTNVDIDEILAARCTSL
jgi:hypothetical protein